MRRNKLNKRGAYTVTEIAGIIVLIAFLVIVILIFSGVLRFSLLGASSLSGNLNSNYPVACKIIIKNLSTTNPSSCNIGLEVEDGTIGLVYKVYDQYGYLGAYIVGKNVFTTSLYAKGTYTFIGNTSGGNSFSPGGECEQTVTCG